VNTFSRLCALLLFFSIIGYPNNDPKSVSDVYVDEEGILRWSNSNNEVSLFGVNYTTPFAYAYRAHKRLDLSLKKAIDLDVAQMKRLGLDAFRVHVWDREISDTKGNVLLNEHMDLFDYLLAKLAEQGIKIILTPIAWWGNGWPEPDEAAEGFSQKYARLELVTNQKAREAERKYLKQFITHLNPYRKILYKNDPSIIAVEIINEPTHPQNGQEVTDYINEMVGVLREAGYTKPIFYNISQNWNDVQANAVTKANIDGVTFQWYPTDLVHGKMLNGNYLVNVNRYPIASENISEYEKKMKMVYEFDAADIGGSYMYPAMARSFREAGMQFATMFSYDPVQIAWSNTEYPTHFLNLLYTPSKSLSLMIAGKAFRRLPRMKLFGEYPENSNFDDFSVSGENDLSEMNSGMDFIYSNSTNSIPKNASTLQHIAGCGISVLVQYDGTGAYFLDKLESGVWRLEVYPDVLWLRDPFEATSMTRQVARLFWSKRKIKVTIPDLGDNNTCIAWSDQRQYSDRQNKSEHFIKPGIYLMAAKDVDERIIKKYLSKKESFLNDLYTPPPVSPGVYVVNKTNPYASQLNGADFKFQIAAEKTIGKAALYIRRLGWRNFEKHQLKHIWGFNYVPVDYPKIMQSGDLEYCITAEAGGNTYTFPEGIQSTPEKWDYDKKNLWKLKVIGQNEQIVVLNTMRDRSNLVFSHFNQSRRYFVDYKNGSNSDEASLSLHVSFSDESKAPFGFQLNVSEMIKILKEELKEYRYAVLKAKSNQDSICTIGLNLIMADGKCYGVNTQLKNYLQEIEIPLTAFCDKDLLILPDSYPSFLPTVLNSKTVDMNFRPKFSSLECVQITVDPTEIRKIKGEIEANYEIISVVLKK
jgi:hypothetical protein